MRSRKVNIWVVESTLFAGVDRFQVGRLYFQVHWLQICEAYFGNTLRIQVFHVEAEHEASFVHVYFVTAWTRTVTDMASKCSTFDIFYAAALP